MHRGERGYLLGNARTVLAFNLFKAAIEARGLVLNIPLRLTFMNERAKISHVQRKTHYTNNCKRKDYKHHY